eukprot:1150273-Pelagomonas_calceolata.AAC.3
MPTGKDVESISDTEEWKALQEHVKDINTTLSLVTGGLQAYLLQEWTMPEEFDTSKSPGFARKSREKKCARTHSFTSSWEHTKFAEWALLLKLAEKAQLREKIESMFAGEHINSTEDRAALHVATRARRDQVCVCVCAA